MLIVTFAESASQTGPEALAKVGLLSPPLQ